MANLVQSISQSISQSINKTVAGKASGGGAFSPLDLNPSLWLDASDATTITDSGGAVSQWDDKSGNANHLTQATGANQPITGTRTVNSLNGLDFDGSNDFMDMGTTIDLTGDFTLAFVCNSDVAGGKAIVALAADNGTYFYQWTSGRLALQDTVTFSGTAASTDHTGVNSNFTFDRDGASLDMHKNGALDTTFGSHGSHTIQVDRIGRRGGASGNYFNGIVCEIVIVKGTLSSEGFDLLETYLNDKWGV